VTTIVHASTDGAARGNPGPAGAGVLITDSKGKKLKEVSLYLGEATNNVAEYSALICALSEAARLGAKQVKIQTDSELVARQISGEYRINDTHLRVLHSLAKQLMGGFKQVTLHRIPREKNLKADKLANRAVDDGLRLKGSTNKKPSKAPHPSQGSFRFVS
tara:strand:- start:143 stop:625 length:483 start_codon:yes stop_codon:yes gene_type:complete